MRVVVTGLVATYPVGGVAWDYLQYVEGFRRLGCDVFYLEDTGQWCYDPDAATFIRDATAGARYLADAIGTLSPSLAGAWSVRGPDGVVHGRDADVVRRACAGADLFLNVSGASRLRDDYRGARVLAFVDTDPGYSQARAAAVDRGTVDPQMQDAVEIMRAHAVFFSLGEHLGAPDCAVPTGGIRWRPTRQPILLDRWAAPPAAGGAFTTVMSWRIDPPAPIVDGIVYGGKDVEFERFLELPGHTAAPLEVAIAGAAPRARIQAAGWHVVDAHAVSRTMADYRGYITGSRGELSIAKNAYVAPRTGWFSTRSAAYLAAGRPVILQDTGFSAHLPIGPGLHAFTTMAEAVAALDAVDRDYAAAARHAREVAVACFAAERVCERLLAEAVG
jgi:hypothetical protein